MKLAYRIKDTIAFFQVKQKQKQISLPRYDIFMLRITMIHTTRTYRVLATVEAVSNRKIKQESIKSNNVLWRV